MKLLRHKKTRKLLAEDDVLLAWMGPRPRDRVNLKATLFAYRWIAFRVTLIGVVAAVIPLFFAGHLMPPRIQIMTAVAGLFGGPFILAMGIWESWMKQRFSNRLVFRLTPDYLSRYEPGGGNLKLKLEGTSWQIEDDHLLLVGNKIPNGRWYVSLPQATRRREKLTTLLEDRLPRHVVEPDGDSNPARLVFNFGDARLNLLLAATMMLISLATLAIDRLLSLPADANWKILAAIIVLVLVAGPGWIWIVWRFGKSKLREARYRSAAFLANCVAAIAGICIGTGVLSLGIAIGPS